MGCTPLIPELRRLKEEDHEFRASLGQRVRVCLLIGKEMRSHGEMDAVLHPTT